MRFDYRLPFDETSVSRICKFSDEDSGKVIKAYLEFAKTGNHATMSYTCGVVLEDLKKNLLFSRKMSRIRKEVITGVADKQKIGFKRKENIEVKKTTEENIQLPRDQGKKEAKKKFLEGLSLFS